MRYSACCLLLAPVVAFGAMSEEEFRECWRGPFAGHLVQQNSRAAVVALPPGSIGPSEDFDTPNYAWTGLGGSYYFKFGDFASAVGASEFDRIDLNGDVIGVFRWKDFAGVDRIIAQWHMNSGSVKDFAVSIPIVDGDCMSISRAREIIRSVKYVNDIDKIKVVRIDAAGRNKSATIVNEVGNVRQLKKGDSIASENQVITSIDGRGVTVGWYDFGKHRWAERRIAVSPSDQH